MIILLILGCLTISDTEYDQKMATFSSDLNSTEGDTAETPPFYLAENGATIICSDAGIGETGTVNGIAYTKQSREGLVELIGSEDWEGLETICTSDITDMRELFYGKADFNLDVSSWDVGAVLNMSRMFYGASDFNQNIGEWDTENVTNMDHMFFYATNFNQNLSGWCVSQIQEEPSQFATNASAWQQPKPVWGTCP